jgi:hypothetical protein
VSTARGIRKKPAANFRSEGHEHHIRLKLQDEFAKQNEVRKLPGCNRVDDADVWKESFNLTAGGLTDVWTFFFGRMANNCREKSADAIVDTETSLRSEEKA